MTTFHLEPTYYQVTWTLNSPTDYSGLTGSQAGGLDCVTPKQIYSRIITTGTTAITSTVMSQGATIIINGYTITFASSDTLANIITKINAMTKFTGVYADQSVAATYITLSNAPGCEGVPFYLQEGNGTALAALGLNSSYPSGVYKYYPSMVAATPYSNVAGNSNVCINNVTIQFTSSNIQSVVSTINSFSAQTAVAAEIAGPYIQFESKGAGQPWVINSGNALANLGVTTGNYGGYPSNITTSLAKEQANMRWFQTVSQLEQFSTPNFVGNFVKTGSIANVAPTTFQFTVGYEHPDQVMTAALPTEPDYGNVFVGTAAVQRAVARAMTNTWSSNRGIFDPTLQNYGPFANFPNSYRIQNVTATGLDVVANINTVSNNITVTQISGV